MKARLKYPFLNRDFQMQKKTFFSLYYKLKVKFPSCLEEYYHRTINEEMEWKCVHPLRLLRIGDADGIYLMDHVSIILIASDRQLGLEKWFKNPHTKACLWCPVCQTYPYPP